MSNYKFGIARGCFTNVTEEEEEEEKKKKEIRSESINLIEEIALLVENSQFQSAMEKISPALEGTILPNRHDVVLLRILSPRQISVKTHQSLNTSYN